MPNETIHFDKPENPKNTRLPIYKHTQIKRGKKIKDVLEFTKKKEKKNE